jgi:dTDP-4-amino-4,6-dideoxygalactose transaminase
MNEVQSAFGLLQLKYINGLITKRKKIADLYRLKLQGIKGIKMLNEMEYLQPNYPYFPIFIDKEEYGKSRDQLYDFLKTQNIFTRRYFYPLISHLSTYKGLPSALPINLPIAEKAAQQVLCLPIYPDLGNDTIEYICKII